MKIKTSELQGAALDWAVAKCERNLGHALKDFKLVHHEGDMNYSTDWSQGGPIIEREKISVWTKHGHWWVAAIYDLNDEPTFMSIGPTPLIAAMRCYVASKLGGEVEIPEELK